MKKKTTVLCVFAHPDDETFGPGGTIAYWSQKGYEIHVLCVTRGEVGSSHPLAHIRENELLQAAKILGIKEVTFLDFLDGSLNNQHLTTLTRIIIKKITELKPDILLTFQLNGVSGHMDHIAVASATTTAFKKTNIAKKLYYYTLVKEFNEHLEDYFINFPEGIPMKDIDETIDIAKVWDTKVAAMHEHKSQIDDVKRILKKKEKLPKNEYFLVRTR